MDPNMNVITNHTIDSTTGSTTNLIINSTINSTIDTTTNSIINSTVDTTTDSTINSTTDSIITSTINSTIDFTDTAFINTPITDAIIIISKTINIELSQDNKELNENIYNKVLSISNLMLDILAIDEYVIIDYNDLHLLLRIITSVYKFLHSDILVNVRLTRNEYNKKKSKHDFDTYYYFMDFEWISKQLKLTYDTLIVYTKDIKGVDLFINKMYLTMLIFIHYDNKIIKKEAESFCKSKTWIDRHNNAVSLASYLMFDDSDKVLINELKRLNIYDIPL